MISPPWTRPRTAPEWMKGTVEDWATESLLAARQAYQVPETGERLKSGQKLGDVTRKRICRSFVGDLSQAGLRLAMVLNEALVSRNRGHHANPCLLKGEVLSDRVP